ncbi:uncharacterized protein EI90DRAFT_258398 [Cantharellus anzutake]|uniref:uncharacterized protein n=1 Tax=Cantharellus anzutake TaxID=1750568 RepID=UPI001904A15B|nr:uncharacterized protein EI90DRAFT_258398 [Cantharellus anzutake]KAF8335789.1 hypothetical protein EI90DRAFT_258398 [Cantharellus anzutake]
MPLPVFRPLCYTFSMYSHSDYYHAPHPSAPRRLSHPNDLNAFADQLEAQAARARAAASFARVDSFPDRYEWQYSNSPTFRNYRDDAHGRPIPCEYHPGPEHRHSRGYDFYDGPRYIPSAQGCPRPSRYPQPYFEENYDDYPERPSCPGPACSRPCRSHISRPPQPYFEDHGEFYERPPYWGSIGSRQCGSPPRCGCSGEPEQCSDVSWVEFDPSTFAAALVPRLDPGQGPRGLARSHGPKCADRSQPDSHEDVPSAVSGLLGLPEKKSCEAVCPFQFLLCLSVEY